MASRRRRRRSPARWLAPLALVVAGVAVYAVVDAGSAGNKASGGAVRTSTASRHSAAARPSRRRARPRTYTVRAGDTLLGIATKTGVSLERIQQLNPKLDSQTLQTGEKIKLGP